MTPHLPSVQRPLLTYLLQEVFLFFLFVFIFLFANTWRALADYNLIRIGVVAIAVTTAIWLVLRCLHRWVAPTPLSKPLLLFILVYLIAGLASIQPRRSLDEVWVFAMYAFGFALTAQLVANGWPRELFVKTLLIAGGLLMGISVWVALSWYWGWLAASPGQWIPDIAFRLPLANGQATYLYLLAFAALARLRVTRAAVPRVLLVLWLLVAALLLFLTASRGGWLATGVGGLVFAFVVLRDAGGRAFVHNLWVAARHHWRASLVLGTVAVVGLFGLVQLASYQLINPQKGLAVFARVEYWTPAWQTFLQRPLLGQGPLTFGSSYLRLNSVPPYGFFAHAHSIFFNLLSETGLLGVLAFGLLAIATFVALWRQVNRLKGEDRAVAVAALVGAVAWAAHSVVDSVNVEPMNSMLMVVLLGAALGGLGTEAAPQPDRRWGPTLNLFRSSSPILLGLILSITGFISIWRITPMYDGLVASTTQQWPETSAHFAEATRRDPQNPIAHQQAGLAYSVLATQSDSGKLNDAIAEFEQVVKLDPDWWLNHANLAALFQTRGDVQAALDEYRQAVKVGSGSPLLWFNYGAAAEAAGSLDEAEQAYNTTLDLRADWAMAYFWRATAFRQAVVAARPNETVTDAPPTLDKLRARAAGADLARDYIPLIEAYLQLGHVDEANAVLKKAAIAYFDTGEVRLEVDWLQAEAVAAQGDFGQAAKLGEAVVDGYFLQSALGPGAFGSAAYGQVFFRQSTMAMDLVPQLALAPFTDKWAERLVLVGDWYAAAGNSEKAAGVYRRVLTLVSDNTAAAERLSR